MTLNERLYLSGKIYAFDLALEMKETSRIIQILREVEVLEESIPFILKELKLPIIRDNNSDEQEDK